MYRKKGIGTKLKKRRGVSREENKQQQAREGVSEDNVEHRTNDVTVMKRTIKTPEHCSAPQVQAHGDLLPSSPEPPKAPSSSPASSPRQSY